MAGVGIGVDSRVGSGTCAFLANRALLALRFFLRSLCSRRISCCLVSHGVAREVFDVVVGEGGGTVGVVVVPEVVGEFSALGGGCS